MPHDKNGQELKAGDRVSLEGVLTSVSPTETACNITVQLDEVQGEIKTTVTGNSKLCVKLTLAFIAATIGWAIMSTDAEARHGRAGCGEAAACGEPASCGRAARLERRAARRACEAPAASCGTPERATCQTPEATPAGVERPAAACPNCVNGVCTVPEALPTAGCPTCPQEAAAEWSDDGAGNYSQVQADGSVHHEHSVVRGERWWPGKNIVRGMARVARGAAKVARGTVRVAGRVAAAPVRAAGRVGRHHGCN